MMTNIIFIKGIRCNFGLLPHKNDVRLVFTYSCLQEGLCLINVFVFVCACPTHIMLCFYSYFVPCVARFSGLSIFDSQKIFSSYQICLQRQVVCYLEIQFPSRRSGLHKICSQHLVVCYIETEFPNRRSGLHKICSQHQVVCYIETEFPNRSHDKIDMCTWCCTKAKNYGLQIQLQFVPSNLLQLCK